MHEPTKELAALKYALTKETRLVSKIQYHRGDSNDVDPAQNIKKNLEDLCYYAGTKNVLHGGVEFNEVKRAKGEDIYLANQVSSTRWEMRVMLSVYAIINSRSVHCWHQ